jgi:hypothetical protein
MRDFLASRQKMQDAGPVGFSCGVVYGEHQLLCLELLPISTASCASREAGRRAGCRKLVCPVRSRRSDE